MKKLSLTLIVAFSIVKVYGQKLPNVQQNSLRAPSNIKIDGKPTDWGGQFAAYNKSTGIFYSIANDNENLFIIIYANDKYKTTKILSTGINICLNTKERSTRDGLLIKYPIGPANLKEMNERSKIIQPKLGNDDGRRSAEEVRLNELSLNKDLVNENKYVKIFGINSTNDTLFSIYNSKDIMVRIDCPDHGLFYYELSVPLKYLASPATGLSKINYNIRLNESWLSYAFTSSAGFPQGIKEQLYATDFWGEYTLAK